MTIKERLIKIETELSQMKKMIYAIAFLIVGEGVTQNFII